MVKFYKNAHQCGRNLAELRISFFPLREKLASKIQCYTFLNSSFLGHTWSKELISGKKMKILPFQVLIILNFKD